jgi:hypothetical protein
MRYSSLPKEASKNFSQTMIALYLLFDYDSIMSELKRRSQVDGTKLDPDDVLSSAYDACENLLTQLLSVGFRTVTLITNEWVHEHVDPSSIAMRLGLHVQSKNLNDIMPASLFLKPMVDMRVYVENILAYLIQAHQTSADMSLVPIFVDSDFFYPMLLLKVSKEGYLCS